MQKERLRRRLWILAMPLIGGVVGLVIGFGLDQFFAVGDWLLASVWTISSFFIGVVIGLAYTILLLFSEMVQWVRNHYLN